ncbi:MAG TPA: class I SAM-dependent methyltransferase [Anaeromyxobacteraceae bacterium]|nr:class I SAM-dependent methyltransferase [Anaeromyxobacteraceae bacterium]
MNRLVAAALLAFAFALPRPAAAQDSATAPQGAARTPDVIYVPTPESVVKAMLEVAKVGPNDVVYDLGCGDGRIAIAAVRDYNAKRSVCVDIDPERIREATANAREAKVQDRVKIVEGDLFAMDFRDATVVTLYLLPSLNLKLRPRLLSELKPGTRIVSHAFDMGDWTPEQTLNVDGKTVYFWTVPAKGAKPTSQAKPQ